MCILFVAARVKKDQAKVKPEKVKNKVPKSDTDDEEAVSEAEREEKTEEEVELDIIQTTQDELHTYSLCEHMLDDQPQIYCVS